MCAKNVSVPLVDVSVPRVDVSVPDVDVSVRVVVVSVRLVDVSARVIDDVWVRYSVVNAGYRDVHGGSVSKCGTHREENGTLGVVNVRYRDVYEVDGHVWEAEGVVWEADGHFGAIHGMVNGRMAADHARRVLLAVTSRRPDRHSPS